MISRLLDIVIAAVVLVLTAPLSALAALGIKLSSPGPVLYSAQRMGLNGQPYGMYKFRTMHIRHEAGSEITSPGDARVFPLARVLRASKIDELPQLLNVIRGEMAIVGPRPESVVIVERDYLPWMKETLAARPGVTSPGAIFGYTHANALLSDDDPEGSYREYVLHPKLALERAYLEHRTLWSDIGVMVRTAAVIIAIVVGRRKFPLPREAAQAKPWFDFTETGVGEA